MYTPVGGSIAETHIEWQQPREAPGKPIAKRTISSIRVVKTGVHALAPSSYVIILYVKYKNTEYFSAHEFCSKLKKTHTLEFMFCHVARLITKDYVQVCYYK